MLPNFGDGQEKGCFQEFLDHSFAGVCSRAEFFNHTDYWPFKKIDSFCSFPDTACSESGRRYADGAGSGVASSCVLAPASTKCVADVALGTSHS